MTRTWTLPLGVLIAMACAGGALARAEEPPALTVLARDATLVVTPLRPYDHLSLRISTPEGQVLHLEGDGGPVSFAPLAAVPPAAAEGQYAWEVLFTPKGAVDPELFARALAARGTGDLQPEQALRAALHRAIVVRSGAFRVAGGRLLMGDLAEPRPRPRGQSRLGLRGPFGPASLAEDDEPVLADQLIADDLIVQGSLCVGFDCVNNESFGFDTIRLKENNLRIKFEDTSSAAGFPSNDWQLTANDSASGGASKFSIEDITGARVPFTVLGGAPTNSVFVDSTGRLGLRTSTPVLDLHAATSNTPAFRMEQTSAGGFTAQTWDVAGNEANFFVRDVTGGSRLPLRIRPGAPTSSLDIAASGNVGLGTASPATQLDIRRSSPTVDIFAALGIDPTAGPSFNFGYAGASIGRSAGFFNVRPDASAAAPNPSLRFLTANVERMIIDNEGFVGLGVANPIHPIHLASGARVTAGGVWTDASSRDLKQDIQPLTAEEARAALEALAPVRFAYRVDPQERHVGFVAEDVPDLVASPDRKGLSPMDLVAVLTRVLKEQQATVEAQQRRIADLASRLAELERGRRP